MSPSAALFWAVVRRGGLCRGIADTRSAESMGCASSVPVDLSDVDGKFTPEKAVGGAVTDAPTALIVKQKFFSWSGVLRQPDWACEVACHHPPLEPGR